MTFFNFSFCIPTYIDKKSFDEKNSRKNSNYDARITSKLEHFVNSEVIGILLSLINSSPIKDFEYDIFHFRDIHPEYYTMKDFEELMKRAKKCSN